MSAPLITQHFFIIGSRLTLIGLGFVFSFSGVEHLWHPDSFTEHYIQSGIGPLGPWIIGTLQLVSGIGLVFWKRRHWVACGVALVMLVAMMNHVRQASHDFPWMAFCIFVLTIVPVFALFKIHDRKQ